MLGNIEDAEDVFQAAFLLLAKKAGSIRKQASVASWLYGVSYRLALRVKTQEARRHARERQAANLPTGNGAGGLANATCGQSWTRPWTNCHRLPHRARSVLPRRFNP